MTPVSARLVALLKQQLAQFGDRPDLVALVVYLTIPSDNGKPALEPIGQWPDSVQALVSGPDPTALDLAPMPQAVTRRWLPLRDGPQLVGALRVDSRVWPWPQALAERLQATAGCLTEALGLDLEQQRLSRALAQQDDQLRLLVHQLRNPLAALRTFGQLLLRRLERDPLNRPLVENLLAEQRQLNRYVDAIDQLARPTPLVAAGPQAEPLLLPPSLDGPAQQPLAEWLSPLLERAAATASLQGRIWQGPQLLPTWRGAGGAVAEILANLLENAFRYSPIEARIGLHCVALASDPGNATASPRASSSPREPGGLAGADPSPGPALPLRPYKAEADSDSDADANGGAGGEPTAVSLTVWDSGPAIAAGERQRIFERGARGRAQGAIPGSGLGLALARDLARRLGGDLELVVPPQAIDPALPNQGNAFRLTLPAPAP
jgi:signal transduction histidine kinase